MKTLGWVALVGLLYTGEASAQMGTGQSGISTSTPLTNVRAYRELSGFGTCFARTQRRHALTLIATVPESPEENKAFRRLVYGEQGTCLFGGTRMAMPTVFARGAIAEGLLRSEGVPENYRLPAPNPGEARDLHGVARCYAAGHRTEVETLLKTGLGSREEVAAVAALWEDFRKCMPGFNVRLNAPWIRFLLAEALLRLPPAAATTSGN
jgi:hypothetical protein